MTTFTEKLRMDADRLRKEGDRLRLIASGMEVLESVYAGAVNDGGFMGALEWALNADADGGALTLDGATKKRLHEIYNLAMKAVSDLAMAAALGKEPPPSDEGDPVFASAPSPRILQTNGTLAVSDCKRPLIALRWGSRVHDGQKAVLEFGSGGEVHELTKTELGRLRQIAEIALEQMS